MLEGDCGGIVPVQVADELGEQVLGAAQLVAHAAAENEVAGQLPAQRRHGAAPPAGAAGHGRASGRKAWRSVFAYSAVVIGET